jgi:hypothetical protein
LGKLIAITLNLLFSGGILGWAIIILIIYWMKV